MLRSPTTLDHTLRNSLTSSHTIQTQGKTLAFSFQLDFIATWVNISQLGCCPQFYWNFSFLRVSRQPSQRMRLVKKLGSWELWWMFRCLRHVTETSKVGLLKDEDWLRLNYRSYYICMYSGSSCLTQSCRRRLMTWHHKWGFMNPWVFCDKSFFSQGPCCFGCFSLTRFTPPKDVPRRQFRPYDFGVFWS